MVLAAVSLSICSAAAAGLASRVMAEKVASEDAALAEEGTEEAREVLTLAAEEGTLSPVAAARAVERGLLDRRLGEECASRAYRDRYGLVTPCGIPYEALWCAGTAACLTGLSLTGAGTATLASCALALASCWLDSARRLAAWPLALGTWAAGAWAAGLAWPWAAGSLAVSWVAFAASGAIARRAKKGSVGRGDDMLLACTLAGCGSLGRACAFLAALTLALAAQTAWLRARGRAGARQPLACSLAPAYLLAWALVGT